MFITYAPIVLFTYNRPEETLKTIMALKANKLSQDSVLYIFSDGPKNKNEISKVQEVRRVINDVTGFKKVTILESDENKGLANSIIHGVSTVIEKYGKVIVMEDDLECSEDYLEFMNDCLNMYIYNKNIWSISGYSNLKSFPNNYNKNYYLSLRSTSWGWATWLDRWVLTDWEITDFERFQKNASFRLKFERGGDDLYKMLELQKLNKIDSWAIRWVYTQFKEGAYSFCPRNSKILNKGIKPGGTHGNCTDRRWDTELSNAIIELPSNPEFHSSIQKRLKRLHDLDWIGKCGYFLRKNDLYSFSVRFKKYFRN